MKKQKGVITLFLSLALTVLLSFLCTAWYSARTAASRYLFSLASEAVTRSVFAVYDTRIWEQYRVLMITDETLAMVAAGECAETYSHSGTLFPISISAARLTEKHTPVENGAWYWEQAAVSYMKIRLPVDMINELWEQNELADSLQDTISWVTGLRDLFGPMVTLEKSLGELEARLSDAAALFQQGKTVLQSLQESILRLEQLMKDAADSTEQTSAWEQAHTQLIEAQDYAASSREQLSQLIMRVGTELESLDSLRGQVQSLLSTLKETGILGGGSILGSLGQYLDGLTDRVNWLQNLPKGLEQQSRILADLSDLRLPSLEEWTSGSHSEAWNGVRQKLSELSLTDWIPEHLGITEGSEADKNSLNQILELKSWLDQGILGLVLENPADVSTAVRLRELPRTERQESQTEEETGLDNLLYGEYVLNHTACYGEDGAASLQYETEYIIAGGRSDSGNLIQAAGQLLLLRGAANLVYLLQDADSRSQVQSMAGGISAALGGWVPAGLVSILLLVLWSLAEAVCDIRALLAAGKVPFLKDTGSWQLDWDSMGTLLDRKQFVAGMERQKGMDYSEYLRLLLLLVPLEEKCYRTMEIAEENIGAYQLGFQMDLAICQAAVTVSGQAAGQDYEMILEYGYEGR